MYTIQEDRKPTHQGSLKQVCCFCLCVCFHCCDKSSLRILYKKTENQHIRGVSSRYISVSVFVSVVVIGLLYVYYTRRQKTNTSGESQAGTSLSLCLCPLL